MQDVYIASAVRTPIGRFGGMLKDLSPVELGAHAMRAALGRAGVEGTQLDLYVFGNVLRAGHGQLLPRQAALKAGVPDSVDGYAVDMVCSSAMMSVMNATNAIRLGDADLVLAGGFESMTQTGFVISQRARWGYKTLLGSPEQLVDVMQYDGLTDPVNGEPMGSETERLAREIAPVELTTKNGTQRVDQDEGIRPDTTVQTLAKLRPAFSPDGVLTAGNSSQISDGAAAVLLASKAAVDAHKLRPLGKILGGTWAAGQTWRFPEAPIPAVRKLLDKLKMKLSDFELFENNEAFALNNLLFERQLGVSRDKLNVHGGAIALGHPIGASGTRLIVTLLNALQERDATYGIAALCHGTGGATALAVERVGSF
ncbi:MAG TPA: thiolase family protein [Candidatus Eremiobacteraceae bacterium]|nr:thiolase family protein [Candidatus Eremiobacteraceae bacterium]